MSQGNVEQPPTPPAASEEKMDTPAEKKIVVGFWLRLVSDSLDAIILGLLGLALAIPLKEQFMKLGPHGIWIGLCIVFLYTGILQSAIGQGQSLGKRLLKIQVLRTTGEFLSLPLSFLRYSVLALIFYNSWIYTALPFLNGYPTFLILYSGFILALMVGCVFLVAFHPAKRGIHDLIAGTVVVRKGMFDKEKINKLINNKERVKTAYRIATGVLLILMVGFGVLTYWNSDSMARMSMIRDQIVSQTGFQDIGVSYHWKSSAGKETTSILISAFVVLDEPHKLEDLKRVILPAVSSVAETYPDLKGVDKIILQEIKGFNIGIANSYSRNNYVIK